MGHALRNVMPERRLWRFGVAVHVARPLSRIVRGFVRAIYLSRGRRAQRDVARYFADRGTPLTDAQEREIAARVMSSGWMRRG